MDMFIISGAHLFSLFSVQHRLMLREIRLVLQDLLRVLN